MKIIGNSLSFIILLTLITIIPFNACKKEADQVGIGLRPEEDIVTVLFNDTTSIEAYTILEDSIKTDETQINLIGSYVDPVFGTTTSTLYTQIRLSENGYDFGDNPVLDSVVLAMQYYTYYGDTNTSIQLRAYQLTESLYPDSVYYSDQTMEYDPAELANHTFYPRPTTPVAVGEDTVLAQLRVRLSDDFGNMILNAPSSAMLDNENWLEYFKGFALQPEKATSGGSILSFDLMSLNSNVIVYYSNDEQDSLQFVFVINDNCARFMNYEHYDYQDASPEFKSQVLDENTELGNEQLYLQAMAGVKVMVKFPYIKNLVSSGKVAINEAKFVINDIDPAEELYPSPNRLIVVGVDEEGDNFILPDQFQFYYGGYYDTTNRQVVFRITQYIQSLLRDDTEDHGLHLIVASASLVANRQMINGPIPLPPAPYSKRLKLNITYTPVE